MSLLNKFKTNSYCVGGRHYSGTNNISGAMIMFIFMFILYL